MHLVGRIEYHVSRVCGFRPNQQVGATVAINVHRGRRWIHRPDPRVLADDLEAADARGDLIEVDALDQPSVLN